MAGISNFKWRETLRRRSLAGISTVRKVFPNIAEESIRRITNALNQGGEEIAAAANLLVPVDEGDLKETIEVRAAGIKLRRDRRSAVVRIVAGTSKETANAAFRQEFGRSPGPGVHPGHAAQPFLFPAYFAKRRRVRGRIKREIRRAARFSAGARLKP